MRDVEQYIKDTISSITFCHRCRTTAKTQLSAIPATDQDVKRVIFLIESHFEIQLPVFTAQNTIADIVHATLATRRWRKQAQIERQKNNPYFSGDRKGRCR